MTAILGIVKVQCCLFIRHVKDYCLRSASISVSLLIMPRSSDFEIYRKCTPETGHLIWSLVCKLNLEYILGARHLKGKLCVYVYTPGCASVSLLLHDYYKFN